MYFKYTVLWAKNQPGNIVFTKVTTDYYLTTCHMNREEAFFILDVISAANPQELKWWARP